MTHIHVHVFVCVHSESTREWPEVGITWKGFNIHMALLVFFTQVTLPSLCHGTSAQTQKANILMAWIIRRQSSRVRGWLKIKDICKEESLEKAPKGTPLNPWLASELCLPRGDKNLSESNSQKGRSFLRQGRRCLEFESSK
jgi:hypothetical protein